MIPEAPGIREHQLIGEEVPGLPRRSRVAFAAGCVERVLPIVAFYDNDPNGGRNAVELGWRFALGEDVPEPEIEAELKKCEQWLEALDDDDNDGFMFHAVHAVKCLLRSLREPEAAIAQLAASEARYSTNLDDPVLGGGFIQEEAEWQVRALDVARTVTPPTRDMFAQLPKNSRWEAEFHNQYE
jgi:hypothetical protein